MQAEAECVFEPQAESIDDCFRKLYFQAPEAVIVIQSQTGVVLHCNEAVRETLGHAPAELIGRRVEELAHPEAHKTDAANWRALLQCEEVKNLRLRVLRRDGGMAELGASTAVVRDQEGRIVLGLSAWRDVSRTLQYERKRRHHAKQLSTLAHELSIAEERERRKIAAALHDDIGQVLALVQLNLATMKRTRSAAERERLLEGSIELLGQASRATRNATFELSSSTLHEAGLGPALQELGEHMKRAYRLPVRVEGEVHGKTLSKPVQAIAFRVVRELLFNCHKHANASNVCVTLRDTDNGLTITIQDDGVGFDTSHLPAGFSRHGGYGLFSVAAQVEGIGGGLSIRSSPGAGCQMTLRIPSSLQPTSELST